MHHSERRGKDYVLHPIEIDGVGLGAMILELYGHGDDRVCGIYQLIAVVDVPPKKWLRIVREQMRLIEQMAKESGVSEMRVAGRSWARVLPDYEPFDEVSNGLRKRL